MFPRLLIIQIIILLMWCSNVRAELPSTRLRIGYLENAGSALVLLADANGLFKAENLTVSLVKYRSTSDGLAALNSGAIQAGTFPAGVVLKAISQGGTFSIIAGGGTVKSAASPDELEQLVQPERNPDGFITVESVNEASLQKGVAIRLVSALIRAHLAFQRDQQAAWQSISTKLSRLPVADTVRFDPNPDYYRLADIWKDLSLQRPDMKRDYLASHIQDEIYCDALDRVIDENNPSNPILQRLSQKAICVPDCCPAKSGKSFKSQGGTSQ